jgi:hypothetical protein
MYTFLLKHLQKHWLCSKICQFPDVTANKISNRIEHEWKNPLYTFRKVCLEKKVHIVLEKYINQLSQRGRLC